MPTRLVREGFISSSRINALSMGAEVLYHRLMLVADDYGRYHGSVVTLRGACWPTNPDRISDKDVSKWLNELLRGDSPLVRTYAVAGATYLEIQNFQQRTRSESRFPAPPWEENTTKSEPSVYFIRAEGSRKIKIGYTELPVSSRLSTLQIGSPEKLSIVGSFPGTMADERATQKRFVSSQFAGEWFEESAELLQFIAEKCAPLVSKMPQDDGASRSRSRNAETKAKPQPQAGNVAQMPQREPQRQNKNPPNEQSEYPLTLRELREHDPATDQQFALRLVRDTLQAAISRDFRPDIIEAINDAAIRDAIIESYKTGPKTHQNGLLLQRVPRIIVTWCEEEIRCEGVSRTPGPMDRGQLEHRSGTTTPADLSS